jgi:two-component system cell cycle sensor histidine kinase/response regulator CckA
LELLGFNVDISNNGEEAIEKYKTNRYDLIFLDLTVIVGMGGKDCIKYLKEIDENVKAIVCSGYSNDPVMTNYKEYGFINILKKPFNINTLNKVISESL